MSDVQINTTVHVKQTSTVEPGKTPVQDGKDLPVVGKTAEVKDEVANSTEEVQAKLEQAVSKLNEYVQSNQRDIEFFLDEATGKTVITVVDRNTSEVIRQLPGDVTLNLARKLNEEEPIQLFSAQA